MNSHKHARLTYARRLEMVKRMVERGWSASQAGLAHGVTAATARKWLGRYLAAAVALFRFELGVLPLIGSCAAAGLAITVARS